MIECCLSLDIHNVRTSFTQARKLLSFRVRLGRARNLPLMRKYLRAAICRPRSGDV